MRAGGEAVVSASLRRQGMMVTKVKKRRTSGGKSIKPKDIAVFTRQLATMMRPACRCCRPSTSWPAAASTPPDPPAQRHPRRRGDRHGLSSAFRKHPQYFDALYCNLVEAGEAGGILEQLLDRLALYQEKSLASSRRSSRR
jgi:type IV pilus assembly protein PilC